MERGNTRNGFGRFRWLVWAVLLVVGASMVGYALLPRPALLDGISWSTLITDREGRPLRLTLAADQRYRLFTPLAGIPDELIEAVLLYEDRWFHAHPGVNPVSLLRGAASLFGEGPRIGGSTVTMQLARLRYGLATRGVGGKLVQIVRALQLERHYSKEEILEAYLNLAPYGGNIEGVGAASRVFFDARPRELTLTEILSLAVVPQAPNRRRPDRHPTGGARDRLVARWLTEHPEDHGRLTELALPLHARGTRALPFRAPHLTTRLIGRHARAPELRASIDLELQDLVERVTRAYLRRRAPEGLDNAAALLLDYRDMQARAVLGSADFHADAISGQVDGTRARRSPGSTLKPFVYALALERGLIHPRSMLMDTPTRFGDFRPANFDRGFAGPLSATQALNRSRNVPAVDLARRVGVDALTGLIRGAGVELPARADEAGLSLVLGGAELSLQDLVRLYAMLANHGRARRLSLLAGPADAAAQRDLAERRRGAEGVAEEELGRGEGMVLPADVAWLTLRMLEEARRPGQHHPDAWLADPLPVAWKTGTSNGLRDAWAVGVFGPYVLGVWVGHFDGRRDPALVGRRTAAPLFFEIADAVRASGHPLPAPHRDRPPSSRLVEVEVCAHSGERLGHHCPHAARSWYLAGASPIATCGLHRAVDVDVATGLRACAGHEGETRQEVYEFWPSNLLALFRAAGVPRRSPPRFADDCLAAPPPGREAPRVTSPGEGATYSLRPGARAEGRGLPLTAVAAGGVYELHWFMDDAYLGHAPAGEPLIWEMAPGPHVAAVVDEQGRGETVAFRVVGLP
jgi:penicillin-binding protein 1C